jgi:hypothetical protein
VGQLSAGDTAACAAILAIGQCTPGTGPSAIETEPFACRRCTVNGSPRGIGWVQGVKTMSPVNGEIGRENRAKTESTRHSPEGDIVAKRVKGTHDSRWRWCPPVLRGRTTYALWHENAAPPCGRAPCDP